MPKTTRNTFQKQTVMDILKSLRGYHPTVETVYEHVSRIIPSISRATVYRILNQFAEDGAIAQVHIKESNERYDDLISPHYHLLCNSCKSVLDIPIDDLSKIQLPKKEISGCKITGVELTFLGLCPKCKKK